MSECMQVCHLTINLILLLRFTDVPLEGRLLLFNYILLVLLPVLPAWLPWNMSYRIYVKASCFHHGLAGHLCWLAVTALHLAVRVCWVINIELVVPANRNGLADFTGVGPSTVWWWNNITYTAFQDYITNPTFQVLWFNTITLIVMTMPYGQLIPHYTS